MKSETIWVGREAYMHLHRISRKERGCKPLTPEGEVRMWSRMNIKDGKKQISDQSLGGGDGTYYGKWWSWSVDTVKKMLDEAGFTYEDGEPIEYMNL